MICGTPIFFIDLLYAYIRHQVTESKEYLYESVRQVCMILVNVIDILLVLIGYSSKYESM